MASLLRMTRQARWFGRDEALSQDRQDLLWLRLGDVQADAFLDLQTQGNRLSVYRVENEEEIGRVVTALAANREGPSNFDYALVNEEDLTSIGIALSQQAGDTPYSEVNENLHFDLEMLTLQNLSQLAQTLSSGGHERLTWKEVRPGLQQALHEGKLDTTKIAPKLLAKIQ